MGPPNSQIYFFLHFLCFSCIIISFFFTSLCFFCNIMSYLKKKLYTYIYIYIYIYIFLNTAFPRTFLFLGDLFRTVTVSETWKRFPVSCNLEREREREREREMCYVYCVSPFPNFCGVTFPMCFRFINSYSFPRIVQLRVGHKHKETIVCFIINSHTNAIKTECEKIGECSPTKCNNLH
jgi:hypothetical protein